MGVINNNNNNNAERTGKEHISRLLKGETARDALRKIANSDGQEEAFFIMDAGEIVKNFLNWSSELPQVAPYYAVKCNESAVVLKILSALGSNFDCASKGEITKVLSLGVSPDRIIFANPTKQASHIKYAAKVGVELMTFDNSSELYKIKQYHPDAKLVLRVVADSQDSQCTKMGMKFGADPSAALELIDLATTQLGLAVVGVSFHVGSGCREPDAYPRALAACREIFDQVDQVLGFKLSMVDIGGGFTYDDFNQMARKITDSIDELFPPSTQVKFIAEPGRFIAASAYSLATRIHSLRNSPPPTAQARPMYYINDGVYGSFNCLLYDHAIVHPIPLTLNGNESNMTKTYKSSIWGPTCDSLDIISEACSLPLLEVGDWLIFDNMGAYTIVASSTFNGFSRPKVHHVATEDNWACLENIVPQITTEEELPYWVDREMKTESV